MRILAVRGENLASLAEPFAVELTAEPLAGAGLFAITGETGAGKSTLLDAVCLALYGEFPRIAGRGADETLPDVDGHTLAARDPRSILRRGAAQGHAEVDFVAVDGTTCRARWSVYRARNKASGKLQKVSRVLERLGDDGAVVETLEDQISRVAARVVELTDLTFDQFRRTVLLAQGDFDAFLRAEDGVRADLLEKITGTGIYARLSIAAFERTRAARADLAALRDRRAAVGLSTPEERAARLERRAATLAALAAARDRAAALAADVARHDRLADTEARLAAALVEEDAAGAAAAAAEADRLDLAALDRARALAPSFHAVTLAERAETAAVADLAAVDARLAEATPRLADASSTHAIEAEALVECDARIAALQPRWEAATRLDEAVTAARAEVAGAEAPWVEANAARDTAAAALAEVDGRRAEIVAECARIAEALAPLVPLAPLADAWSAVEADLRDRIATRAAETAASARRAAAEAALAALDARLADLARAETAAAADRAALDARFADRRAVLVALDVAAARDREAALARLAAECATQTPRRAAHAAARSEAGEAIAARDAAAAESAILAADRAARAAALAEARAEAARHGAALRLAEALASAEADTLRAALLDGEPCPVCGARDHPLTADPTVRAAIDAVRAEAAARAAAIAGHEAALAAIDGRRAAAEARHSAAERALATAEARLAADARLTADVAALAAAATALDLPAPDAAEADAAWDALAAALAAARAALAERLDRARLLAGEVDALRDRLDRLAADTETRRLAARADEAARSTARAEAAAAAEAQAGGARRRAELDARLGPRLADLDLTAADLDRDGDRLVARLAAAVAEHRRLTAARDALAREEATLERARHGRQVALEHAGETLATALAKLDERRATLGRLVAERAGLLDGRPTAEHRAEVDAARRIAVDRLDRATAALVAARRDHDTMLGRLDEGHKALANARDALRDRRAERDRALAAADLDYSGAVDRLARPVEAVEALRARLDGLDRALRGAADVVAARRRDAEEAEAAGRPTTPRADLVAALDAARDAAETAARDLGALDRELADDEAARVAAAGLEAEIAAAETATAVVEAVGEAIGSADGGKFRRFAQGITLDRLTGLANRHLATLNPRYRLARTDGLGLAIVDRDMGDEWRSTRSLSGGERFLASLALALALSGLEGRRSFVDTLFIDEGFGSLDAATLDVAIDALEALQSEGRKVGVISHVAAMHERIPVRIRVERAGLGRSRVRVGDPT